VGRAAELLLDIVFHSTYPEEEMRHEVEVVLDEIESYNDSPAELIYDDFEALIFEGQPLGRNILGKAEALKGYRSDDVKAFARRMYKPENSLMFVYGA
jgi:predicted Zn-dependent peptidase